MLVLTTLHDDETVFAAIRAGAHGYLLKDASEQELLRLEVLEMRRNKAGKPPARANSSLGGAEELQELQLEVEQKRATAVPQDSTKHSRRTRSHDLFQYASSKHVLDEQATAAQLPHLRAGGPQTPPTQAPKPPENQILSHIRENTQLRNIMKNLNGNLVFSRNSLNHSQSTRAAGRSLHDSSIASHNQFSMSYLLSSERNFYSHNASQTSFKKNKNFDKKIGELLPRIQLHSSFAPTDLPPNSPNSSYLNSTFRVSIREHADKPFAKHAPQD